MMDYFGRLFNRFINIWQTTTKTGQQVARGSLLLLFSRIIIKGLQFIKTIIVARLLFPDDFGLFGLATLTMSFLSIFFQHSFPSAVVQRKDFDEKTVNCAWTANVIKNTFIAVVLYFVGPWWVVNFFHNPAAIPFVKILPLIVFIEGWENIGSTLLSKELKFNKLFFYNIIVVIFESSTILISAYFLRNAWALMLGMVVNRLASFLLSYILHPFRPKFYFDYNIAKNLFKYGKWISLSGMVTFLTSQGDNLMIGHLLNAYDLGIYSLAFALGSLPAIEISKNLSNILFPFFSKIQSDAVLLRTSFVKLFRVIFALIIPALTGIYVLSKEIVSIVYSDKWLGMVPILPAIILIALLNSFQTTISPLFLGIGKPKISTLVLIIQSIIMFILIVPFIKLFGVIGAALAVLVGLFFSQSILFFKLRAAINLGFKGFFAILSLPVLSSGIMFLVIKLFQNVFVAINIWWLVIYVIGGALVYVFVLLAFDQIFGHKYSESWLWIKKNL